MPHNRTRAWVGLAIAAVTIPAVGQYYYGARNYDALQSASGAASTRWAATRSNLPEGRLAVRQGDRDYEGELSVVLNHGGAAVTDDAGNRYADPLGDDNPIYDISPLNYYSYPTSEIPDRTAVMRQPNLVGDYAPTDPPEEPVANLQEGDEPSVAPPEDPPGLSDDTVYSLIVDRLPASQRGEFVRTWAGMTPDQRADLMDEFREKLQPQN